MKAVLLRGEDLNIETFESVIQLLQAVSGMCSFSGKGESIPLPEKPVLSWPDLFSICQKSRMEYSIPKETFIFLLTEKPNFNNFFGYLDPENPTNGFVHAGDWERFIHCPAELPVAYHIIALMVQQHIVNNEKELVNVLHREPIGCVNDYCQNKKEVILKMRTADICPTCMERLTPKLSPPIINHIFDILESLRIKMLFAQNMRQHMMPSPIEITADYKIKIPAYGQLEIRMTPLEKALYLLYFNYPEGIHLTDLINHKQELYDIYASFSPLGSLTEMRQSIDDMCNALNNSASEKISKIKMNFEKSLGKELAKNYYIQGTRGERKSIKLTLSQLN